MRERSTNCPDPPTLVFLEKSEGNPEESKGFSLRGTPKILGKGRKNEQKKQGKSENAKSKEIEKARIVRAARVQNEIAPEKLLNRYENLKRFEKREKGSEKRSETRLKKL